MSSYKTRYYRGCRIRIEHDESPSSPRELDNLGTMACWHRNYKLGDEQPKEFAREFLEGLARDADKQCADLHERLENLSYQYTSENPRYVALATRYDKRVEWVLEHKYVVLSLGLLDHSGVHMYCGGGPHWTDSAGWDSGPVGFIYVSLDRIQKEYPGVKTLRSRYRRKYRKGDQIHLQADNGRMLTRPVTLDKDYVDVPPIRKTVEEVLRAEVETYDQYLRGDVFGWVAEAPDETEIDACWGYFGADETDDNGPMITECAQPAIDSYLERHGEIIELNSRVFWSDPLERQSGPGTVTCFDEDTGTCTVTLDGDEKTEVEVEFDERAQLELLSEHERNKHSDVLPLPGSTLWNA